jgi:hypothetical protein
MRKLSLVALLLLSSLFLISCQKEPDFSGPIQPGGTNNGVNTRDSYHPVTPGSFWKHKDTATGAITTGTVLNITKTINNILHTGYLGSNSLQTDTAWIASPQPNYYLAAKGVSPNTGASFAMVFHYLNDTASAGYNWEYIAGNGNGFTAYIKTTIMERNLTMSVSGKTFTNVIHTRLVLSYDVLGSVMEFMIYDYFIAKGVGIIKVRSEAGQNLGFAFKACSDLVEYSIK